jgi:hypothetical protein
MTNLLNSRIGVWAAAVWIGLVVSGCKTCKPGEPGPVKQYTLQIALDPGLANDSVAVDVVGITPSNLPRWQNYSMTKYWQSGDEMRQDADKITLSFGSGKQAMQSIAITNKKWADWRARGVTQVAVLADLPGIFDDKPEPQDARRQILSLCECSWPDNTTNLIVDIKRSGVEVRTNPRLPQ